MAGIKRKSAVAAPTESKAHSKKVKVDKSSAKRASKSDSSRPAKSSKKSKPKEEPEDLVESDTSEDENGFYGFSANKDEALSSSGDEKSLEVARPNGQALKRKESSEMHPERVKKLNDSASGSNGAKGAPLAALNGMLNAYFNQHVYY